MVPDFFFRIFQNQRTLVPGLLKKSKNKIFISCGCLKIFKKKKVFLKELTVPGAHNCFVQFLKINSIIFLHQKIK